MFETKIHLKQSVVSRALILFILLYCLICYSVWLLEDDLFWWITDEDGPMENFSALYFLLCSLSSLFLFFKSCNKTGQRNGWFLVLALLFFVFCGEEISWGQRIFDIQTPERWKKINVQQELNFHNLIYVNPYDFEHQKKPFLEQIFTMNAIYAYFVLGFCFLLPCINKTAFWTAGSLDKLRLPLVPLTLGYFFVATYLIDKLVKFFLTNVIFRAPNEEIREHLWSFLFLMVLLCWMVELIENRSQQK